MAETKADLVSRAQWIANEMGTPRYVVYTSLGWRIEREPSKAHENLMTACLPAERAEDPA